MIGFVALLCVVFIIGVAVVAIPADVRSMIAENCQGSSGRLKLKYILREMKAVARFYSGILLGCVIVAAVLLFIAIQVHEHLIPIPLAKSAIFQFDLDPENWKRNLSSSPGNVKKEHRGSVMSKGGSAEDARNLQQLLWVGFPIALLMTFVAFALSIRLTSTGYDFALTELVKHCVKRDRQRIKSQYLHSTAQFKQRRKEQSDNESSANSTESSDRVED